MSNTDTQRIVELEQLVQVLNEEVKTLNSWREMQNAFNRRVAKVPEVIQSMARE